MLINGHQNNDSLTLECVRHLMGDGDGKVNSSGEAFSEAGCSRKCLEEILNHLLEGVWLIDSNAKTVYTNRTITEMLGYSEKEMLGQSLFTFMDDEGREIANQYFERRRQGISEEHTFRFLNKNGSPVWALLKTHSFHDQTEQFLGTLAFIQNISELHSTVLELKKSESRMRPFFDLFPVVAWSVDCNFVIQSSYGSGLKQLGLADNVLVGVNLDDFLKQYPSHQAEPIRQMHLKALSGESEKQEYELGGRSLFGYTEPQYDDDSQKIIGCLGIALDVTDQRKAQHELKLSESRLNTIIETAPDAILILDQNLHVLTANRRAVVLFGLSLEKMVGPHVSQLINLPQEFESYFDFTREGGFDDDLGSILSAHVRQSEVPIEISIGVMESPPLITLMVRDVSKISELKNQIVSIAEDQQRRIGRELHDDIGQEITGASMMMDSILMDLREESVSGEIVSSLERVAQRLKRSRKLVRNLSHGLIRTGINGTNLSELIGELALNSSEMSDVWCHWMPPASMPILNPTSATHLYRIVQESVTNALKHSQAKNIVITVMPGEVDGLFELRVEDDGKGMVSDSKQMGMGLLIMQYRAKVLGAKLRLESSEELGTTVICEFWESKGT